MISRRRFIFYFFTVSTVLFGQNHFLIDQAVKTPLHFNRDFFAKRYYLYAQFLIGGNDFGDSNTGIG